jgi:hypothetical protein
MYSGLTYFLKQSSSWKANRLSASEYISHVLCNPNDYDGFLNSLSLVRIPVY